jgi:hypothetical protein
VSFTFRYVSSFKIGANHAEPTGNRDLVKPDRLGAFSVARDLGEYRFEMITPPGDESAIVTFEHGGDNDDVVHMLARAGIDATVRGRAFSYGWARHCSTIQQRSRGFSGSRDRGRGSGPNPG